MGEIDAASPFDDRPARPEEKIRQLLRNSRAPGTLSSYRKCFKIFASWCERHDRHVLPASAETLVLFLSDIAERYRFNSIRGFINAIAFAHRAAREPFDRAGLHVVLEGIRRVLGTSWRQAAPITVGELRSLLTAVPDTTAGARDRAVLTLGFAGALRSSEIAGLDLDAAGPQASGFLTIEAEGVRITLLRSKTDQQGKSIFKLVPRGGNPCPVAALEHWLAVAGITSGPVFRPLWKGGAPRQQRMGHCGVSTIVKKAVYAGARQAGMSEAQARSRAVQVSSHSLRVGFVTSAGLANVTSEDIAQHVGWAGTQMVFRYMRQANPTDNNPARCVLHS
jgi:integrase